MDPAASSTLRVIVIGGGLAGMAAAVALEAGGADVTLLEARRSLGGRAGSFQDPRTGEELDNCQHVLLGCCTNLLDFYRRIGAADLIRYDRSIRFLDAGGRCYAMSGMKALPAPLHLGASLLRFGLLSWSERLALSRAMLAMMRIGEAERLEMDQSAFGDWLDAHRQPPGLVEKFYEPVLVSALNESARRSSAAYAIQVFQGSLLNHAAGYLMGVPRETLARLYARLPCRDARLGVRVEGLRFAGDDAAGPRVVGVELRGGERLEADAVIVATGRRAALRLATAERAAADARFSQLDRLEDAPILGAHLWFDRPVMPYPHAALAGGPLQWLFRKDDAGMALHGVISAAREWVGRNHEAALVQFQRQIHAALPGARDAVLRRGVIVVEKQATFSPLPGADRHRPDQAPPPGGIDRLYLAGDYTRTGWPATMEGAVRSGYLAAHALLRRHASTPPPPPFIVPNLPLQWPAKIMGRRRE